MFFSDDLLTSKKGSFGIIWLMATLGPRSKKITRKQLAAVDLAKTCSLIAQPPEPMALRLSGALLVGIARVYNQSFEIFYADVNTFHTNLRRSIATDFTSAGSFAATNSAIELSGSGKSKPEQITVGGTEFNWDADWNDEFANINWNNPTLCGRKRRASSVLSSSQATPQSQLHEFNQENEEEEGYESEVGRQMKRKKYSAPPSVNTLQRTPLHAYPLSNHLYSGPDLDFAPGGEVDLGLDLNFDAPGDTNDSFSGPNGRELEMPLIPMGDGDYGMNIDMGTGWDLPAMGLNDDPAIGDNAASVNHLNRQGSVETVEQELEIRNQKNRKVKKVSFDKSLEISQVEDINARMFYKDKMIKDRQEAREKEDEKQLSLWAERMVSGAGGLQFFEPIMNEWFSSLTRVSKFKWQQDLNHRKQGKEIHNDQDLDKDLDNNREMRNWFGSPPVAQPDAYDVVGGMDDFGADQAYNDDSGKQVGYREQSLENGSEQLEIEYARRETISNGNLPWETGARAGSYTPGFPDFADTSFTPGSLRYSLMTPQELRMRQNSLSGSHNRIMARHRRIRSSSLLSDRPDDDPLMLAPAPEDSLELPLGEMDLEQMLPTETQQARLADLPEAFKPEMLATLEKQCRDFFIYIEKRMVALQKENVEFEELVPITSGKHIAAIAFYDCLTLATKKVVNVHQLESWGEIDVEFAVSQIE
ncbi:uncharacterized protein L203_104497 [Cryptococcus depauperatus CBS 7841]|uniref:Uncharacterized protein n=1 Tax=Cryptococcus depauperatus CBS 7841 TaxID=1295531 RepID=A0A1E3ILX2_9TREE|nr:hypothetical protein L203_02310 [Cryptococcus depauperatus CBS 7841]